MIAVILILAAILFFFKPEDRSDRTAVQSEEQPVFANHHLDKSSSSKGDNPHNEAELQSPSVMQAIEPNAMRTLIIPAHFKQIDTGFLFSFDQSEMAKKKVGDDFEIQMLQFDINRQAKISHVEVLEDDITQWEGHFEGYPEDINRFTVTQSLKDRYTILKVFTDKGSFIAEIKDGIGLAKPEEVMVDDGLHKH